MQSPWPCTDLWIRHSWGVRGSDLCFNRPSKWFDALTSSLFGEGSWWIDFTVYLMMVACRELLLTAQHVVLWSLPKACGTCLSPLFRILLYPPLPQWGVELFITKVFRRCGNLSRHIPLQGLRLFPFPSSSWSPLPFAALTDYMFHPLPYLLLSNVSSPLANYDSGHLRRMPQPQALNKYPQLSSSTQFSGWALVSVFAGFMGQKPCLVHRDQDNGLDEAYVEALRLNYNWCFVKVSVTSFISVPRGSWKRK